FHLARVEVLHQHQDHQGDIQGHVPWQAGAAIGIFAGPPPMTPHDLAEGVPRQGTFELEKRMRMIYIDRNRFALFGCLWAKPRRTMAVFFHEVLLRGNTCAYPQTEQKEQRLFNPRRARCAPWVGSTDRGPLSPLRDLLYIGFYGQQAPAAFTSQLQHLLMVL